MFVCEDIVKPRLIHHEYEYNQNMGGVDNVDRQLSITEAVRKKMQWYRKQFFHLVDINLSNAHASYKIKSEGQTSFPSLLKLLKMEPKYC